LWDWILLNKGSKIPHPPPAMVHDLTFAAPPPPPPPLAMDSVFRMAPSTPAVLRVEPQRAPAGAFTEDEQAAVDALRNKIEATIDQTGDDGMATWSEAARAEAMAHLDDFTIQRFIVARPASLDAAELMFRNAMHWRVSKGINKIFVELHPLATPSAKHAAARAYSTGGLGGLDKAGIPYFVMRIGRADLAGFSRQPRLMELMMDSAAANLEGIFRTVRVCSALAGSFVKCLLILDMAGLSFSTIRHIGTIKSLIAFGPEYFPEGVSKVLIVNAPRLFAGAWSLVSPLLPQRSRDKVSIWSSSQSLTAMLERVDRAELPVFLGGEQPEERCLVARAEPVPSEEVLF
jgi:hypothetical protein